MPRKPKPGELDEPTKIDADIEQVLEAMLKDPDLPPFGEDFPDEDGAEDSQVTQDDGSHRR